MSGHDGYILDFYPSMHRRANMNSPLLYPTSKSKRKKYFKTVAMRSTLADGKARQARAEKRKPQADALNSRGIRYSNTKQTQSPHTLNGPFAVTKIQGQQLETSIDVFKMSNVWINWTCIVHNCTGAIVLHCVHRLSQHNVPHKVA